MEESRNVTDVVSHYESYINDVLKEDLKKLEFNLSKTNNEIAEFNQIKQSLKMIQNITMFPKGIKTQVDVGCNFFIEAKVPDVSTLFFDIGLNHYLEFTKEEADKFIDLRLNALEKMVNGMKQKVAETKAHIKLMLFGIGELQNLHTDMSP